MARIELRNTRVRLVDGHSNTALVNGTPVAGDTDLDIDGMGTVGAIPVSCRFTVIGSEQVYTVTGRDAEAVLSVAVGDASAGTWTITIGGQTTTALAFGANTTTILAAIVALSNVIAGDFTVTGTGSVIDPFIIRATTTGQFAGTAVTMTADTTGLTATTDTSTQTVAGGTTTNITFTPAIATGHVPADNAAITFSGRTVEVKVGDGNITYTETKEYNYDLDRGNLDTVREGDQQPMEVSIDMTWEFLTAISGAATPTLEDALKNRGPAASWVSASSDLCEPYCVDVEIEHIPRCSGEYVEVVTLPDFRQESLEHSIEDSTISCSGRCNATEAIVSRRLKV